MPDLARILPVEPSAVRKAREALEALSTQVDEHLLETLRICVSELVTNSIRHAGMTRTDRIEMRVSIDVTRARVEIHDAGPGFELPPSGSRSALQDSGWGLYLLDQLADRWGVESQAGGGTTVWLEIDC